MRESGLYRKIREWAYKEFGHVNTVTGEGLLKIFKMSMVGGHGEGGWPDMEIFVKGGHVFLMELKSPEGHDGSTELQRQRQAELRELGFRVYEDVDNFETAKLIIAREVESVLKKARRNRNPAR